MKIINNLLNYRQELYHEVVMDITIRQSGFFRFTFLKHILDRHNENNKQFT